MAPPVDPWAKLDAWRSSPGITAGSNLRRMFPGLALGAAAAAVAIVLEEMLERSSRKKNSSGTSAAGGH
jgi:hypothetical protein